MKIEPYLLFDGNCKEAFELYASVLGGEIVSTFSYAESPDQSSVPPEWRDKIMHARMIVQGQALMASDAPPGRYHRPQGFSISISVDKVEEAERIFAALSDGGKITMPLSETFWAARFGMFNDRFGTSWMINCERK